MPDLRLDRRAFVQAGLGLAAARRAVAAEPLQRAADFIDSIGVNTHLGSEPYVSNLAQVRHLLAQSGIRHLRDELPPVADAGRWRTLADPLGLRFDLLVSPVKNSIADILTTVRAIGVERLSGLEGQNEGDGDWFKAQPAARPTWDRAVVAYQRDAYRAVRPVYSAAALPVLSPSVLDYRPEDAIRIRDAAPFCDIVSIHSYVQHGQEPETTDDYAGIGWYLRNMRDAFKPGAPAMSTETGYNTLVRDGGGMSDTAAGIYLPRLLLNNFSAGVRRTYLYEFMDEGTSPDDSEQHWGLVRSDGTPKPAFLAIAALLQALGRTAGAPVAAAAVPQLAAPNPGGTLRRMTFRRDDGTIVAALWHAVRCWDPVRGVDVPVAPEPQRVTFDRPPRFCRSMTLDGQATWRDHTPSAMLDLPVGAAVTLFWFG